jgi:triphosphoribosyl-dephospho-CoA synthase
MNCSSPIALEALAGALIEGARRELELTPKPGLVDRADCGSHPDLSFGLMQRSIDLVAEYLSELVVSLSAGEGFAAQRAIAQRAEQRLFAELGTNTHKGYIFLSGMLLIARQRAGSADEDALRHALAALCTEFFAPAAGDSSVARGDEGAQTNGGRARRQFNSGGIVAEALAGYPSVFEHGLPAYRAARRATATARARGQAARGDTASFALLARLMQNVDDTTTLHRAGPPGLARIKRDGARLERCIAAGDDHHALLDELNRDYVRANITIGGVADLIGICYALLIVDGEI